MSSIVGHRHHPTPPLLTLPTESDWDTKGKPIGTTGVATGAKRGRGSRGRPGRASLVHVISRRASEHSNFKVSTAGARSSEFPLDRLPGRERRSHLAGDLCLAPPAPPRPRPILCPNVERARDRKGLGGSGREE